MGAKETSCVALHSWRFGGLVFNMGAKDESCKRCPQDGFGGLVFNMGAKVLISLISSNLSFGGLVFNMGAKVNVLFPFCRIASTVLFLTRCEGIRVFLNVMLYFEEPSKEYFAKGICNKY